VNELHLFAGAGGGILGGMLLGHTCVCAVEIEPYCRKVLLQRQRDGILPKFPIWDDVRTFDGRPWRGRVDLVAGGFPCQDISHAGGWANGQKGINGERSGLWSEMFRVVCEIRPRHAFIENSSNLLIYGFERVLSDLASVGYDAKWGVLRASDVGAIHERSRIWVRATDPDQERFQSIGVQSIQPVPTKSFEREFKRAIDATIPSLGDSDLLRNHDDVAGWVDRFSAIGNGQVPAVVKLAWETLSQ
jgi:DNA (cytosine-5)-methyltransferase 1